MNLGCLIIIPWNILASPGPKHAVMMACVSVLKAQASYSLVQADHSSVSQDTSESFEGILGSIDPPHGSFCLEPLIAKRCPQVVRFCHNADPVNITILGTALEVHSALPSYHKRFVEGMGSGSRHFENHHGFGKIYLEPKTFQQLQNFSRLSRGLVQLVLASSSPTNAPVTGKTRYVLLDPLQPTSFFFRSCHSTYLVIKFHSIGPLQEACLIHLLHGLSACYPLCLIT